MLSECYHPIRNGVVTSVATFSNTLRKRGNKVTILTSDNKNKNIYHDKKNMVYRFPSLTLPMKTGYPLPIPIIDSKLSKVIYENDFDLLHSQSLMTMGQVAKNICKKRKLPLVFTYHTLIEECAHYIPILPSDTVSNVARDISYKYCMSADHVIVPSDHVYDKLKELGVTTKISVVPTGICLNEIDETPVGDLTKYGIPAGAKTIVYAGRFAVEKNIPMLLNAFEALAGMMKDVHLLMVGGGPLYDECLEEYRYSPIADRIHFTDYLPKPEVLSIFKAADIMLFTSYSETQGLVFAESMASNTPVVATDSLAAKEIIESGVHGILSKNNKTSIANSCREILTNDDLYRSLQTAARKRAEEYDTELMTDKLLSVYDSVLQSKRK